MGGVSRISSASSLGGVNLVSVLVSYTKCCYTICFGVFALLFQAAIFLCSISLKSHKFCCDWCWSVATLSLKLYQNYCIYETVVYCTEHVCCVIHTVVYCTEHVYCVVHAVSFINLCALANTCHSAIWRITKHSTKILKFCFTQTLHLYHVLLYSDIVQSGSWLPAFQRKLLLPSSQCNCILKVFCGVTIQIATAMEISRVSMYQK